VTHFIAIQSVNSRNSRFEKKRFEVETNKLEKTSKIGKKKSFPQYPGSITQSSLILLKTLSISV
jgi:hypothetical protein